MCFLATFPISFPEMHTITCMLFFGTVINNTLVILQCVKSIVMLLL